MAFDGNGTYSRIHNWGSDAANNIDINAPGMDAEDNSIAGALNIAVTRDGQGKMTADFVPNVDNTLNLGTSIKRWFSINGTPIGQITGGVPVNVMQYGAIGNGTADDSAALNAAFSSGASAIYLPSLNYRCSSGITIPAGVSVYSFGFQPTNPPSGTRLTFDLSIPTCVTLGGAGAANGACSLKGVSILRAAGAPPAGSIGLLNRNTNGAIIEDVQILSHQICLEFLGDKTVYGDITMVNRLYTGAAYDSHVVIDTFPEVRFNQCRFGTNGAGDQNCNSYIRIQGGSTTNPANGPNTSVFANCQFNQGVNSATYLLAFQNQTVGTISDVTGWWFDTCYIEADTIGIFSDATWTNIGRFMMTNCEFNPTLATREFVALNAATQITNWVISNCIINGRFTVAPTPQINFLSVDNCQFLGNVSITGTSGSGVAFSNNIYNAALTVAGIITNGTFIGGFVAGTFTHTATGNITYEFANYNALTIWTPVLQFGGASVGITYGVQQATSQIIKNMVFYEIYITLTAKGSSVGGATIVGLPVADNAGIVSGAGGGLVTTYLAMAGITGTPVSEVGGSIVNLYQPAAVNFNTVTDANFTNTTTIRMAGFYVRAN